MIQAIITSRRENSRNVNASLIKDGKVKSMSSNFKNRRAFSSKYTVLPTSNAPV
jgi:hypothetical protein